MIIIDEFKIYLSINKFFYTFISIYAILIKLFCIDDAD
jgi:hypothetical protein